MDDFSGPYRKPFFRRTPKPDFGKIMDRKESSIQRFTDNKELSIIVTSSINNAVDWMVSQDWWKDPQVSEAKRWDLLDKTAKVFIRYFAENRGSLGGLYEALKQKHENMVSEAIDDEEVALGGDDAEDLAPEMN